VEFILAEFILETRKTFLNIDEKHYDSKKIEISLYQMWLDAGVFNADPKSTKPPFSIVIPPPNVTGRLHMGHALNNSVQDTLIRYKRMDGYDALWVPGTDHAGISTQSVVKKQLDAQGIDFLELGREKMLEKIWEWKEKYGDQILLQLRRLGCSCDWSMTSFTMDENLSRAVLQAFKKLYDDGLIYRGKYIVNWCPVDRTALSDDEVTTEEGGEPGYLWHIKYPLADGSGEVIIATTRPETMLGDAAIAVNPGDLRYQNIIGKFVKLPLSEREIPIIADDYVDQEFGTGCLKVTPAHDPYDFQIGLRHSLPQINVMTPDAKIGDQAPKAYHGLDRFECRSVLVQQLQEQGYLLKTEERNTPVGRAQRSKAIIEYRLSDQWFVKMKPLAEKALKYSDSGDLQLFPERWEKIYRHWLENTRDWCVSRQIWWGHRIPAWYHKITGEIAVGVDIPEVVRTDPENWEQDNDVLDTWFSSALWPYSTLGWPDSVEKLNRYYPTSVLSTAKDIIYFWVARMVMTGAHLVGDTPFNRVYFHPVICDARGETMSKSKGNGIDPLHVIDGATLQDLEELIFEARPDNWEELLVELRSRHQAGFDGVGADALRFTLLSLNSQAQQVQISLQRFEEVGKRFIDKIWNASRFVISKLELSEASPADPKFEDLWILGRLDSTVSKIRKSYDSFNFSEAASSLYHFFWDDFCDCYVELTKSRLKNGNESEMSRVQQTLVEVLSTSLKLLHPMIPFVTEELWGHLRNSCKNKFPDLIDSELCILANFPKDSGRYSLKIEEEMLLLQDLVREVRAMRASANIPMSVKISLKLKTEDSDIYNLIIREQEILNSSAGLESLDFCDSPPSGYATSIVGKLEIYANLSEHLDLKVEKERNETALRKVEQEIEKSRKKLENPQFLERAAREVVEEQRINLSNAEQQRAKILQMLEFITNNISAKSG
jgi:valyl-tRNA synthetase